MARIATKELSFERLGLPRDIAPVVDFLCSLQGRTYLNYPAIMVDSVGTYITTTTIAGSTVNITATSSAAAIETFIASEINGKGVIGLAVEWDDSSTTRPALMQLCAGANCLVVQLLHLDHIPTLLKNLLADTGISFVGVGIGKLKEQQSLIEFGANCVELGPLAARIRGDESISGAGLVELARVVLERDEDIAEKNVAAARSDWAEKELSVEQIVYAATDAYLSSLIAQKLLV